MLPVSFLSEISWTFQLFYILLLSLLKHIIWNLLLFPYQPPLKHSDQLTVSSKILSSSIITCPLKFSSKASKKINHVPQACKINKAFSQTFCPSKTKLNLPTTCSGYPPQTTFCFFNLIPNLPLQFKLEWVTVCQPNSQVNLPKTCLNFTPISVSPHPLRSTKSITTAPHFLPNMHLWAISQRLRTAVAPLKPPCHQQVLANTTQVGSPILAVSGCLSELASSLFV